MNRETIEQTMARLRFACEEQRRHEDEKRKHHDEMILADIEAMLRSEGSKKSVTLNNTTASQ